MMNDLRGAFKTVEILLRSDFWRNFIQGDERSLGWRLSATELFCMHLRLCTVRQVIRLKFY